MNELGFPATGDIVLRSAEAVLSPRSIARQDTREPTNEELMREANGGIDPWFLTGNNAALALEEYRMSGAEGGQSIDFIERVKLIGDFAILQVNDGIKIVDTLSPADATLIRASKHVRRSSPERLGQRLLGLAETTPPPVLTTAEKWKVAIGVVLASSGITPIVFAMPQLAQMGVYGVAVGGAGLGLSAARSAWQGIKERQEIAETKEQEKAALLQRGEELAAILAQSQRKLLDDRATFVPDKVINIDLKKLKKRVSDRSIADDIEKQLKDIDPPTADEMDDMQRRMWGPTSDMSYWLVNYGELITRKDINEAIEAIRDGRKERKKRRYTLDFNPAKAVTAMMEGIYHTNPEYLPQAWHGAGASGIKQHVQQIAGLYDELHRGDRELERIKTINDGMQYEHNGDKMTERQHAAVRQEKETALHIAALGFIRFGQDITKYLVSRVYKKTPPARIWEQPEVDISIDKSI